jgi:short subunit dehydrogenase-like uncharacterized protein
VTGRLVVADRSADAAARALQSAGGRGTSVAVDVTDGRELRRLLSEVDVVLNCVGPYYRFGPLVLSAAIDTGTTYLDVCDDGEPTLEALERFGAPAVAAGVTAVVGQGASPGTSNLIARAAVEALPDCRTLITGWSLDDDPGDPDGAANDHWLEQATGTVRVWRDGRLVDEPPLSEVPVHLVGHEPRTALVIGHPEAVTLPRRYPELQTCLNTMTLPGALARTLQRAARRVDDGDASVGEAARQVLRDHVPGSGPALPEYPGVWAIATAADGSTAHGWLTDYGTMTSMATVTAAPLVAGMELLLSGRPLPGVLTPEDAFAVADYFAALARVAEVDGSMLELQVQS